MEGLTLLCCTSAILATLATFFWARCGSRRVRLYSAILMGPSVAVLSAVVFHSGTFIYHALTGWKDLGLAAPTSSWSLFEWLRYSSISMIIPLIMAIVLLVIAVIVNGMGPDDVISLWDGFDTLTTGAWLPDALGCITLGSLILGAVPYGIFYGVLGFLLGATSRVIGESVMSMQDSLALLAMTVLVWITSLVRAIKAPMPHQPSNP